MSGSSTITSKTTSSDSHTGGILWQQLVPPCLLLANALIFYILFLRISGNYSWGIDPTSFKSVSITRQLYILEFFGLLFLLMIGLFTLADLPFWVLLIVAFVPFEFSKPFLALRRLTPLDYFCAAGIVSLIIKLPWLILWRHVLRIFGLMGLLLWFLFFLESTIACHLQHGELKGSLRWLGFLFCYFITALAVKQETNLPRALAGLLGVLGTFTSTIAIRRLIQWHSYIFMQSLFGEHNILAAFLSLCLPPMWWYAEALPGKHLKTFCQFLFVFVLVAFILTYSRGAWAGLIIGFICVALLDRVNKLHRLKFKLSTGIGILLFGILLLYVVRQPSSRGLLSSSQREIYIQTGLRILRDHPWMGLGPGNFVPGVKPYLSGDALALYKFNSEGQIVGFWVHLHNLYLQMLVEHGLIGFSFWIGALGLMVVRAVQVFRLSSQTERSMKSVFMISIIAFLVHNCVDIVKVNSLDMIFGVFLAIVTFSPQRSLTTLRQEP
jgi:putative inorganic carbon (hco3(-)) transporter